MGNGQDYPNPLHTGERLRALARANQLLFSFFNGATRSERAEAQRIARWARKISWPCGGTDR